METNILEVIKMAAFIVIVLGVMVGTLLASGVMLYLATNPKVMKWYTNRVLEQAMDIGMEYAEKIESKMEEA